MNQDFLELYASAIGSGCETTLQELIAALELAESGMILEQVENVRRTLTDYKLEVTPDFRSGDLSSYRILKSTVKRVFDVESINVEIANGEGPHQEFKETLFYDVKRALAVPDTPVDQLKSQEVIFSSLKTIAAFLTCGGGTLFVGVTDKGLCSGIERDFDLIQHGSADSWENELRSNIEARFDQGKATNDYVSLACVSTNESTVARISVQGRKQLSFIRRKNGEWTLYRRQGNRSIEVAINELEEFLEFRLVRGWR